MRQQRLNWLSLMCMENDILKTIYFMPILKQFSQRNSANVCVQHLINNKQFKGFHTVPSPLCGLPIEYHLYVVIFVFFKTHIILLKHLC